MAVWRFDQGRLNYFQFDEIRKIALALAEIDGIEKPSVEDDILRKVLSNYSEQPFAPADYTVWRNYKRVFGCLFLAADISGKIICTELCKILATDRDDIDVDDYLRHFSINFYYPSPIFEGYNKNDKQIFPAIAVIKFLISRFLLSDKRSITTDNIANYLIANETTGLESIDFYANLIPKKFQGDFRQPRELLRFISQFSFLKWNNPNLYLEVANKDEAIQILELLRPQLAVQETDAGAELLKLGSDFQGKDLGDLTINQMNSIDTEFTEGAKVRATHLRTERSEKLRDFYFNNTENPHLCNMCAMDTLKRYPWANRIIELHHLLPLSSPVRVDSAKTSIQDIAGVCPTCHRATHKFYSTWLRGNGLRDFRTYKEARDVYEEAKREVVIA